MAGIEDLRKKTGPLPEGRCLAGFSGGADSTAMMLLLAAERDAGRLAPEAVHVNHGLRGEESDGDEAFCREMCEKLGIVLHTVRAELQGKRSEDACRAARYGCFREIMKETGIRDLILAHNRDDLAETFLMRLIRGAGGEGLACMSGRDEREDCTIWRPMLGTGREEIRSALRQDGIGWREDSLNESGEYLRNRIRRELIPLMEGMTPGAGARIAQAAEILTGENRMLQAAAEAFLAAYGEGTMIPGEPLTAQPEAMRRRILRTWWKQQAPEREEHALNARQTAELTALAGSRSGKVNLPGGLHAVKGREGIYLTGLQETAPEEVDLDVWRAGGSGRTGKAERNGDTGEIRFGEIPFGEIRLTVGPSEGNPGNGVTAQEMPADMLRGCVIRTRQPGDRIRPFGMTGHRKLQDYLTDRGIDEPMRDRIPLICRGKEILLAAGVGAGDIPAWNPAERNIRLTWSGRMPWMRRGRI